MVVSQDCLQLLLTLPGNVYIRPAVSKDHVSWNLTTLVRNFTVRGAFRDQDQPPFTTRKTPA